MKANRLDADQAAADGRTWLIAAHPSKLQAVSGSKSLSRDTNNRGQQLQLNIKPATEWTSSDLCLLDSLVQDRNRFVCLQLVTMAREQHSKAAAAAAAANAAALHAAQNTFLATASILPVSCLAAGTAAVAVVAAGLFYPRLASKDDQPLADPHVYLELMCCNRPGQGYGTLLLQHIEQFVADNCDALAAGWFRARSGGSACAAAADPAAAGMTGQGAAGSGSHGGHDGSSGSTASDDVEDDALIGIASDGCSTASWSSGACLTGSKEEAGLAAAAPGAAAPRAGTLLPLLRHGPGSLCCSGCAPTGTSGGSCSNAAPGPAAAATMKAAAVTLAASIGDAATSRRIRGIKLLSVGGAQSFYSRLGYQGPDGSSHEMFKALS